MSLFDGRIFVSDALITAIGDTYSSTYLMPGYVDIHNHGAVGVDVNSASANDLLKVSGFLAANGVSAWMPTLVPDSESNYKRSIVEIDAAMELQTDRPIAQIVGVHYEGVFANEAMCGALRPEYFRNGYDAGSEQILPKLSNGIHLTTLAPEIAGGIDLIKRLVADGWIVSIGHTKAGVATLDAAFEAGARHLTHFFNAMTGIHHREIGVAGWGLTTNGATFDIIADGIHVEPRLLGLACRAKGVDSASLISDSVAPTGLGDGEYELWDEVISVVDGKTRNERGSIAGSVCTMADCVATMILQGFSLDDISKMASGNPSKLLGIDAIHGSIEIGKRADIVEIDRNGKVISVVIGGEAVEMK